MAKDTYYFSHDYNARNDEKILELRSEFGAEGYGVFWMIVETMAENENGGIKASLIGGLSLAFGVTKETIKKIIEYCISIELFYNEDGFVFSRRLKKHKQLRIKLSEDGKKGAENRWKNGEANGGAIRVGNGDPNAKERKGKEIKVKEKKGIEIITNADGNEKNYDFNEILNPASFPTWRAECSAFLKDEYFKQGFCKDQNLPMGNLEELMREFVKKLNLENDFKNLAGLKVHFTRHYKKHLNGKVYTAFTQSKGFIDVPDNLDYDKMEVW